MGTQHPYQPLPLLVHLHRMKHEEYPGWSLADVDNMAIDPLQLANLNRRLDEDDEDYDEEG
ncbi:hypothetical protein L484_024137 [Morus notabilis]|uniref:Uncharacterized protein n=1 Tax=Morus notabilis TaxID=981085 RepID=W9RLV4_9ROSA|nr:hypothetical protein L484_024137 [Morus notabilis]